MEQNLPVIAKKAWSLIRVIIFMLKKSISKTKFLADLNIMIKRGKIAGKALHNLFFHHHHHHNWAASTTFHPHPHHLSFPTSPAASTDSEFSCTTTPPHPLSTHNKYNTPPPVDDIDDIFIDPAVVKALEMLTTATTSPLVKQLRITDSPFPLSNGDGDGQVDEAADKFIQRFYNQLRRQN